MIAQVADLHTVGTVTLTATPGVTIPSGLPSASGLPTVAGFDGGSADLSAVGDGNYALFADGVPQGRFDIATVSLQIDAQMESISPPFTPDAVNVTIVRAPYQLVTASVGAFRVELWSPDGIRLLGFYEYVDGGFGQFPGGNSNGGFPMPTVPASADLFGGCRVRFTVSDIQFQALLVDSIVVTALKGGGGAPALRHRQRTDGLR